jgi:uncharacterized Zn-binding protein involved in type VI secretion
MGDPYNQEKHIWAHGKLVLQLAHGRLL